MNGGAADRYPSCLERIRRMGPGWVVTAAFIGPGTVTTATVAGARFGSALLWALSFATLATIVLQEMAARLGLVTGAGLGEAIRRRFPAGAARWAAVGLVIAAIAAGNAAYETGNLLGGALGLGGLLGGGTRLWAALMAAAAFALLWSGSYRAVERALVAMVGVMSAAFVFTAVRALPEVSGLLRGALVPSLPGGSALLALGLVGTTVVPYNLFLHAAAVREKWSGEGGLAEARLDLVVSIAAGGLVSMAIVVTSAGTLFGTGAEVTSAADMARQLEPLFGRGARVLFAIGFFAAGMTSAITAPLAAAYATAGALGWPQNLASTRLRAVWMAVLAIGCGFALAGVRPVPAILFAQMANGVLLPAVALFLLVAVNDRRWMGERANRPLANVLGAAVVLVTAALGVRAVLGVLGVL